MTDYYPSYFLIGHVLQGLKGIPFCISKFVGWHCSWG